VIVLFQFIVSFSVGDYALVRPLLQMLTRFFFLCGQGVRLELCTLDRQCLLADVTRTFRENGLNVTRAEISTTRDMALNVFYVTDAIGNAADPKLIESVRQKIGTSSLKVKELPPLVYHQEAEREDQTAGVAGTVLLSLGSLVKRNLYHLGLIRSYS